MLDPISDFRLCLLVGLEPVLPDTFELERSHERFRDAILLRGMRKNELLMQAVGLRELMVELA
jgi:hypothetical protein